MTDLVLIGGRYVAFIGPAYGVSVLVFAWMITDTLARARRWRREAERLERERELATALPREGREDKS